MNKLLLFCAVISFVSEFKAQNGIYSGSGSIPSNTTATVQTNFIVGSVTNVNQENGNYVLLNTPAKHINLISQGKVRIGDPNEQGLYPAWLEVDATGGTVMAYASTDMLWQCDSNFYSFHKGGFQLPVNLVQPPNCLLYGDRGLLYFNDNNQRLYFFDGQHHQELAMTSRSFVKYVIMNSSGPIGSSHVDVIYAQPTDQSMTIYLPPVNLFDERKLTIKNISTSVTVVVSPTANNLLEGTTQSIDLAPMSSADFHATNLGWYVLSKSN